MGSEWRKVTIGDLAEIFDGPHATPRKTENGPVFLGISNLSGGRIDLASTKHLSEEDHVRWTKRVTPEAGDVVFSYETRLGEAALIPEGLRCCLGRRMGLLRPRRERVNARFLLYAYLGPSFQETLRAGTIHGSTVDRIPLIELESFPIEIPNDMGEQRAIAHVLGTLDDKIELNRRMNETLEAMARALFKSWFVDFDPVRAKMEDRWRPGQSRPGLPAHICDLFPARLVPSELGEIPEGWEVKALEDVLAELETGGRPKGGVSKYSAGVPSIGAESIVGLGVFDYSKTKYVPQEYFDSMKKGHVQSRDVLLYKDGGRPGEFQPHVSMLGDGFPFTTCAINEHVYRLRANEDFGQNLLFFWISSDLVMEEMRIKGTGVAVPGLNSTQARSLTTLVPAPGVASAFDEFVGPIVTRILAALRDTLLPKLISGELQVKDAKRLVPEVPI